MTLFSFMVVALLAFAILVSILLNYLHLSKKKVRRLTPAERMKKNSHYVQSIQNRTNPYYDFEALARRHRE